MVIWLMNDVQECTGIFEIVDFWHFVSLHAGIHTRKHALIGIFTKIHIQYYKKEN